MVAGTEALWIWFSFCNSLVYCLVEAFTQTESLCLCLTVPPLLFSRSLSSPSPLLRQVRLRQCPVIITSSFSVLYMFLSFYNVVYLFPSIPVCLLVVFCVVLQSLFSSFDGNVRLLYIFFSPFIVVLLDLCIPVWCACLYVSVCPPLYSGSLTQSTSMSHIEGVGKTWSKKPLR